MVNPPLLADVQLKNQPASSLPGGVTYVNNIRATTGRDAADLSGGAAGPRTDAGHH
jgi:hypothetical protein